MGNDSLNLGTRESIHFNIQAYRTCSLYDKHLRVKNISTTICTLKLYHKKYLPESDGSLLWGSFIFSFTRQSKKIDIKMFCAPLVII